MKGFLTSLCTYHLNRSGSRIRIPPLLVSICSGDAERIVQFYPNSYVLGVVATDELSRLLAGDIPETWNLRRRTAEFPRQIALEISHIGDGWFTPDEDHRYRVESPGNLIHVLQLGRLYRDETTRGFIFGKIGEGWKEQ